MKTNNLVEALSQFDIRTAAYKKPPVHRDVFALTILPRHKEGVVTINQGLAKTEIFGDKSKRQAAVTVQEKGRIVTRTVNGRFSNRTEEPTTDLIFSDAKGRFPVIMPTGSRWTIKDIKKRSNINGYNGNRDWNYSAKVTARVAKTTTNHYLIGMDETHHFVAPLPSKAESVKEAHELLRPKRIAKTSLRQGEWFFTPCTEKTCELLETKVHLLRTRVLGKTTHSALSCIPLKKDGKTTIYARGYIVDEREGHHRALHLDSWHKVVRNKEATIKVSPEQRKTMARRRQTWD